MEKSGAESTLVYVDEFLVLGRNKQECLLNNALLEKEVYARNMVFNEKKSMKEPSQVFDFIGYKINLMSGLIYNKDSRIEKLEKEWSRMKRSRQTTKGKLMRFLGKLNFAITNKMHLIYLSDAYTLAQMRSRSQRSDQISMTHLLISNVDRALAGIKLPHQSSIFKRPERTEGRYDIYTDASGWSCGIIMKNMITKETQQIAIGMPVELQRVGNCAAFKEMLSILLAALLIEENADMTVLTDAKSHFHCL